MTSLKIKLLLMMKKMKEKKKNLNDGEIENIRKSLFGEKSFMT